MKSQLVKEQFDHDDCPECGAASVPAENVPDQALRGCSSCGHTWMEDLSVAPKKQPGYTSMSLWSLANIIQRDWVDIPTVTKRYLSAMLSMEEHKCLEGHLSIVGYFLCNSHCWKGDVATEVKAELNRRLHPTS